MRLSPLTSKVDDMGCGSSSTRNAGDASIVDPKPSSAKGTPGQDRPKDSEEQVFTDSKLGNVLNSATVVKEQVTEAYEVVSSAITQMEGLISAGAVDQLISSSGKTGDFAVFSACVKRIQGALQGVPGASLLGPIWAITSSVLDACAGAAANRANCFRLARLILVISSSVTRLDPKRIEASRFAIEDLRAALDSARELVQAYQAKGLVSRLVLAGIHTEEFASMDSELRAAWQAVANDIVVSMPIDARYEEDQALKEALLGSTGAPTVQEALGRLRDDKDCEAKVLEQLGTNEQIMVTAIQAHMDRTLKSNKSSIRRVVESTIQSSLQAYTAALAAMSQVDPAGTPAPQDFAATINIDVWTPDIILASTDGFSKSRIIGSGGYADVYWGSLQGVPGSAAMDVAIKRMRGPQKLREDGMPVELATEAELLSVLRHVNIVRLLAACRSPACLVYELCPGGSLAQRLQADPAHGGLGWLARVRVASEVASAIAYMHGATGELFGERHEGIFHRDIKPENILLSSDGDGAQARVSDFGTARAVAARMGPEGPSLGTSTMTKTVGTTPYMCPRYFRTGRFGAKSDVFSLGVMLLQLATGMAAHEVHHLEETSWSLDARAGAWPKEVGDALVALGRWCVNETYEERPGMDVVAERLKQMEQAGKTGNVDMLQVEDELMKAERELAEAEARAKEAEELQKKKLRLREIEAKKKAAEDKRKELEEKARLMALPSSGPEWDPVGPDGALLPEKTTRELPGGMKGELWTSTPCLRCGCPWWRGGKVMDPCCRCGWANLEGKVWAAAAKLPPHKAAVQRFRKYLSVSKCPPWPSGLPWDPVDESGAKLEAGATRDLGVCVGELRPDTPCVACGCPWWSTGTFEACCRCGVEFGQGGETWKGMAESEEGVAALGRFKRDLDAGKCPVWGSGEPWDPVEASGALTSQGAVRELDGGVRRELYLDNPCLRCGCPWWGGSEATAPCLRCGWVNNVASSWAAAASMPHFSWAVAQFRRYITAGKCPPWVSGGPWDLKDASGAPYPHGYKKDLGGGRWGELWPEMPCLRCGCPWWTNGSKEAECVRCRWWNDEARNWREAAAIPKYARRLEWFALVISAGKTPAWDPSLV